MAMAMDSRRRSVVPDGCVTPPRSPRHKEALASRETPDAQEGIEELGRLSHNHDILDHRFVDTRDTFAEGKSLRAMAQECGLP